MAEKDGSNREDKQSSRSEHDGAETSRPTGSFSMAHALSMIRRRQEDQQRAREEEEERLDKEKKTRAREKRQRRRQNQRLRKAKIKEEEEEEADTSNAQIDSNDGHAQSVNELRGLKRSDTQSGAEGMSGTEEEDDDDDDERQVLGDDSKIPRQRSKRFKTNATNELSSDQTTYNGAPPEQTKATLTANKSLKQLIPRALLIKRKPPSS